MKVKSIMHKGAVWVDPSATLIDIAKKMRDNDIGAIPVQKNGKIVGIVTDRDIACRGLANGKALSELAASDVMSKKVSICHEIEDMDEALALMEKKKVRRLPVLGSKDTLTGMLSLGDISRGSSKKRAGEMLRAISAHHA